MALSPLHARSEPISIIAVVCLLVLWILGAGLVGGIIAMLLWKNPHTVAANAWLGVILGLLGFLVHFLIMMSKPVQAPSNPTSHIDAHEFPLSANIDSTRTHDLEDR